MLEEEPDAGISNRGEGAGGPTSGPNNESSARLDMRNLQVMSWSFCLVFLAFGATQGLESSLHPDGAGTAALGVLYVCLTIAGLWAPILLQKLGTTKAMTAGFSTYAIFILSNLYPVWWTLIPAAACLGVGAATLWNAQGVYLSLISHADKAQAATASGIFFLIFQLGPLAGNVIAYIVLHSGNDAQVEQNSGAEVAPQVEKLLFLIFTASACAGVALSTRLEDLESSRPGSGSYASLNSNISIEEEEHESYQWDSEQQTSIRDQVSTTMLSILWLDETLLMLIPLFAYSGAQAAWAWGDFTGSVIKPVLGMNQVPVLMTIYSFSDALSSWMLGKLNSSSSILKFLLSLAALFQVIIASTAGLDFLQDLNPDGALPIFVLLSILLGFTDAACNTLITAMLASRPESQKDSRQLSFAHFKLWQSLAIAAVFFASAHLSLATKSAFTVGCGIVGISLFLPVKI